MAITIIKIPLIILSSSFSYILYIKNASAIQMALTALIEAHPEDAGLYVERGKWHYRLNAWGDALNDFNRALAIAPGHCEARQFAGMVQEILEYRYKDIYNP